MPKYLETGYTFSIEMNIIIFIYYGEVKLVFYELKLQFPANLFSEYLGQLGI